MIKKRIAIFASGNGSNAENIFRYFKHHEKIKVVILLANKPQAHVLNRAQKHGIETCIFNKHTFLETDNILQMLQKLKVDLIVLAGFLWLIPQSMITTFPNRIINIHPALLPKYGGKGMYGMHVHQAVIENKDTESGITIHYVNPQYDQGQIIFQTTCKLSLGDTPEEVQKKVHQLEREHFPKVIERTLCPKDISD